jgi:hypothetical protein
LSRVCSIIGPGAQPRVVLIGRLALYGPGAARLHEELLMVTAAWSEPDRRTSPLRPFGGRGEEATLDQLEQALRDNRTPSPAIIERLRTSAIRDAGDLEPELQRRTEARRTEVARELVAVGEQEADALRKLLVEQRERIARREAAFDDRQLSLEFDQAEAEQARRDRRRSSAWKNPASRRTSAGRSAAGRRRRTSASSASCARTRRKCAPGFCSRTTSFASSMRRRARPAAGCPFRCALATVAGRPMLGGLKLALNAFRLHNDTPERRLPALLKQSRDAQAEVSAKLAEQVLGSLH